MKGVDGRCVDIGLCDVESGQLRAQNDVIASLVPETGLTVWWIL